jgi:hypothetical protein
MYSKNNRLLGFSVFSVLDKGVDKGDWIKGTDKGDRFIFGDKDDKGDKGGDKGDRFIF